MLFTAEIWDHLKHASSYGIDVAAPALNWKNVLARKDDVITRHTKGLDFLMKKNKITTFKGFGRLTGPAKDGVHTVDVKLADGSAQTVKAKKVVLATGIEAALAALLLSSCATLTPDQEAANAVTRHEQRAEGIQDPMKER